MTNHEFNEILWNYYAHHGRHDLPWRQPDSNGGFDPYKIVVSELMLQQTQVSRVIPKFHEFLMKFPATKRLAAAPLGDVLVAWSGLGYNRRAKFLWQTAIMVEAAGGRFPNTLEGLVELPGIGKNTAGAVLAYAYNQATAFVETNIRTVYIHHFFHDHNEVSDAAVLQKVNETLDHEQPREFYWALMDYGTHLKQTVGNVGRQSKAYVKQSAFIGSKRQVRGQVLRALATKRMQYDELMEIIKDPRLLEVLNDLSAEKLIQCDNGQYHL